LTFSRLLRQAKTRRTINYKTLVTSATLKRDFVAQLYRATESQLASVTWRVSRNFSTVAQLLFRTEQFCRENAVNADWSILVYATKLHTATLSRDSCATKSRDKIAGVTSS